MWRLVPASNVEGSLGQFAFAGRLAFAARLAVASCLAVVARFDDSAEEPELLVGGGSMTQPRSPSC